MKDVSKHFNPQSIEAELYRFWEEGQFFAPKKEGTPYSIILPPPNVTGILHMGHALVNTLQDILIRYRRMMGDAALWIPGTDHAGISTQTVVERHLFRKTGKKRTDFTREEFVGEVWRWKEEHEHKITQQLRRLGSSLDWSRQRFTMDKESTCAVQTMFKKLFDQGLIYRGDYLVNWDPVLQTAIADDEVEYEEKEGHLWHFEYPVVGKPERIVIATTRPETLLGDVAIAVHPGDLRYRHLIGEMVTVPIVLRRVPVIADPFVDRDFATGAVKITPAHDFADYEVGKRHNLPLINIMNPDGTLTDIIPAWQNFPLAKVRLLVAEKALKKELHMHRVGVSYRTKAVIEPYLSKQWFIKMEPFKKRLIDAVKTKSVELLPESWEHTYFHWIENLRDWCISRQLWWGHRIPVWYRVDSPETVICYIGEDIPPEVLENPEYFRAETDVLDTWFSSALWPMTTLGWPNNGSDFARFFPTSVLVTGHDILFFWVARMIMMSLAAENEIPFRKTFVHGLIYGKSYWRVGPQGEMIYLPYSEHAEYELGAKVPEGVYSKWEKMSKSKGNVIDPIEIIDLYGTDALRFTLASSVTENRQIDLDRRKFEEFKNFSNKVWNASRFVLMSVLENSHIGPLTDEKRAAGLSLGCLHVEDKWILTRLDTVIQNAHALLEAFDFDDLAKNLYAFFWDEFCAYYLEMTKPFLYGKTGTRDEQENKQKILLILLSSLIRLLHPIAPFITEQIFLEIKQSETSLPLPPDIDPLTAEFSRAMKAPACIVAPYPLPTGLTFPEASLLLGQFQQIIYHVRNLRGEWQVPPGEKIDVALAGFEKLFFDHQHIFTTLLRINLFFEKPPETASFSEIRCDGGTLYVQRPQGAVENEGKRRAKEKEKNLARIASLQEMLGNKDFLEKAPEAIRQKMQSELDTLLRIIVD